MAKYNSELRGALHPGPRPGRGGDHRSGGEVQGCGGGQRDLSEIDQWGKRRLAYPINDLNEGHYVLMTFTAAPRSPLSWTAC